jgi:glycosyltransferase involved in cell wall biosynthesis
MQETRLSVALVTRNRPSSLERTLQSLRNQTVQPWEVIISDDSDSDQAAEVRGIAVAYQSRYILGPHRGLYANRNHVALACNGTHIRSMDDDHEFPTGHMSECIAAIDRDRTTVWIIGEFLPDQRRQSSCPECPGQLHPRGFSVAPLNPDACWAISDGASIYPREIFDRGLRLAEGIRFGAAYLEFGSRLQFLGYRIRQLRSTYVLHHYEASKRSLPIRKKSWLPSFLRCFVILSSISRV